MSMRKSTIPALDELHSTITEIEVALTQLKKYSNGSSLSGSLKNKILELFAVVKSVRARIDEEKLVVAEPPVEKNEFNCVETAMENLHKRIRAGHNRIVADTDETESESENVVTKIGESVTSGNREIQMNTYMDEKYNGSGKNKRKRTFQVNEESSEEDEPRGRKIFGAIETKRLEDIIETDSDTESSPQASIQSVDSIPVESPAEPPHEPSTSMDVDEVNGDGVKLENLQNTSMTSLPKRKYHDPATYSGDSSDEGDLPPPVPSKARYTSNIEQATPKLPAMKIEPGLPRSESSPPNSTAMKPLVQDDQKYIVKKEHIPSPPSTLSLQPEIPSKAVDDIKAIEPSAPSEVPLMIADDIKAIKPSVMPEVATMAVDDIRAMEPSAIPEAPAMAVDGIEAMDPSAMPEAAAMAVDGIEAMEPSAIPEAASIAVDNIKAMEPSAMPEPASMAVDSIEAIEPPALPEAAVKIETPEPGIPNDLPPNDDIEIPMPIDEECSSSSSSSDGSPIAKRRVSVWHTTNPGEKTRSNSSSSSSSSEEEEINDSLNTVSRTARPSSITPVGGKENTWPNLDHFHSMLVNPAPPALLPKKFKFPTTYPSIRQYANDLKQAIVEECLCAFDTSGKSLTFLAKVSLAAVSPINSKLQSLIFRIPKSITLQSHDLLCIESNANRRVRIPGIAIQILFKEDIVFMISTAHTVNVMASYTLYQVGNSTTDSREYQAALSLPTWPISFQQLICSALVPQTKSLGVISPSLLSNLRKEFNQVQFEAIQMAVHQPITLIQGPPGTGKTHTIVGIIKALLQQPSSRRAKIKVGAALGVNTQPNIRILVTAPSNAAVNVLMDKIQRAHPEASMVRLGQPTSRSLIWLENLIENDRSRKTVGIEWNSQEARERLLDEAQIVFCTLSGAGSWTMWCPKRSHFDAVIVDEAAQATEASSLIPLRFFAQRYVFVGDHKQLPATILSPRLTRMNYDRSLFQRLVCNRSNNVIMLREQYRMHPEISAFPSSMFYANELINMNKTKDQIYHSKGFPPYFFYDILDGEQSRVNTSYRNEPEVRFIARWLSALLEIDYDFRGKIGIISPYKSQIEAIKDALAGAKLHKAKIEVNTVDGFQGREKEILILSCVRTFTKGGNSFWGDIRRMNVSLTRAISSCWIIGSSKLLEESHAWSKLIEDCKNRNLYMKVNMNNTS